MQGLADWLPLASATLLLAIGLAVPGALVATAIVPRLPLLERLALAPAVGIGIAFAVASWASVAGVDGAPALVAATLVLMAVVAGVVVLRRPRPGARLRERVRPWHVHLLLAGLALVLVWVVAVGLSTAGPAGVPPGIDANTHGLMLARILDLGTIDPDVVTQYDLAAAPGTTSTFFYILGPHAVAAPVAALTSVPATLWALEVLASLWLVLGVLVLARRCGLRRGASAAVWVSALTVPLLPFSVVFWGGMPLMLGLALVPPVALLAASARDLRSSGLLALAVAGLVVVHTTELIVVALMAFVALLLSGTSLRARAADAGRAALAVVAALVLAAPTVAGLAAGGADRAPDPSEGDLPLDAVLRALLEPLTGSTYPAGQAGTLVLVSAAVAIALAGIGAVALRRSAWGAATTVAVVVVLLLATVAHIGVLQPLVRPWYASGERIATQAAALLPVLAGAGIERVLSPVRDARRSLVAATAVLVVVLAPLAARSVQLATSGIDRYSVVTAADRDAFAWLAEHARPGERVLGNIGDGSTWMYVETSGAAVPLFGAMPSLGFAAHDEFDDIVYLRANVDRIASDAKARGIAADQRVRYVLVGERTFAGVDPPEALTRLASAPGVHEVFRSGPVRVYEITAVGG